MRNTVSRRVSKLSVEISKRSRELAKLQRDREQLMIKNKYDVTKTPSDIDFSYDVIEELTNDKSVATRQTRPKVQDIRRVIR